MSEIFYFIKKERRAFSLLILMFIVVAILPSIWPRDLKHDANAFSTFEKEVDRFLDNRGNHLDWVWPSLTQSVDVNKVTVEELGRLGIPEAVALRWHNYREAIDGFKSLEQVNKIYGIDTGWVKGNIDFLDIKKIKKNFGERKKIPERRLFSFDPNQSDKGTFEALGFSKKAIDQIITFKARGGIFRSEEELQNIFGINDAFYREIEPYIKISKRDKIDENNPVAYHKSLDNKKKKLDEEEEIEKIILDINRADEWEWQKLKGIGPFYARRITQFRQTLGGFINIDQIADTYGLPDSVFQSIKPSLVQSPPFRQIAINAANADSLKTHPYISWKEANILVNYRKQHGPYLNEQDLFQIKAFDSLFVQRIGPYLTY